ncbi:ATP-binding cassette domain-containing protein [candidate division GN15 bacterium]|nr:ATP-binding cassette domain-containing protein [candidate division GN15 bacterium]
MIRLEHVTHLYADSDQPALHDVSLTVRPGEAVCVMGRNGSGKSTLIKIIAGLLRPTRGQVHVNGATPADDTSRAVGILFQNADNQMVATVVEKELAFSLENQAASQAAMETAISETCERFRLTSLRTRLTSELSGGEKQRVALGSIMIQNPPVLLLDEPDTFLDAAGQKIVREELRRLHAAIPNLTELRISHSPAIARDYQRLIVFDGGEITVDDEPEAVFQDQKRLVQAGLSVTGAEDSRQWVTERLGTRHVSEIAAKSISFGYDSSRPVIDNVNMSLTAGETVALVGATGVGKTSLGLLLCGVHMPSSGSLLFRDETGSELSRRDIRGQVVAVLQQAERQFFLDSCAREVAFGPSNLGHSLTPAEIDYFLDLVGLPAERFRKRDPFTLSEGEKRRLAFATALSMSPSFLIFDEPTAGLDPAGVGQFLGMSRLLRQHGLGQLVISHDRFVVEHVANRVLFLRSPRDLVDVWPSELDAQADLADLLAPSHFLSVE